MTTSAIATLIHQRPAGVLGRQAALVELEAAVRAGPRLFGPPFAKWFVGGTTGLCDNAVEPPARGPRRLPALIYVSTETSRKDAARFAAAAK